MNWKLAPDGLSAIKTFPDGSQESRMLEAIPAEELATALPTDPPTPEQLAAIAQAAQDKADAAEAKAYAKLAALKGMTPTQVSVWVEANVTSLAQAKDAIKTLAIAVSILARKL